MDFNMPHIDGIELTKLLLGDRPDLKILILSMYNEERHIESFRSIGRKDMYSKQHRPTKWCRPSAKCGTVDFISPEGEAKSTHANDTFLKKLKLSNREMEVIRLIKAGLKTKEIAEKLNISFYTAENTGRI